ncbi:relaxase/mobilization nuclease domain-containing protein [Massilia sp. NEAU-DD11]|uniref:Relaxase/mobilization nuclease domain-containing protein n=1 Tax=Massilia cellulosiltytica TaxID=2683234 RepID=A0A7X3G7P1_9BURK|nr:relaxase/mobilization nuclease domain-containing protein [Telluria cellulosilytica]MVW64454.1 relaxase/mobilization nuclease domain-containing protein [Telluria cellulosilytica]
MSLIEAEATLGTFLNTGKVRRKINNTGRLLLKARRISKRSPEVMVKITGFGKGTAHIKAHLSYITRNAKVALETHRGDIVSDKHALKDLFNQWADDIDSVRRHKNQRDTMHLVLSMPEGTPETAVHHAARGYAKRMFGANHEYVFALHTDEPHPHVHLTVKLRGFDGKRLNPRKADLQDWREAFAREMRDQGIEAEASPRSARGVVRRAEKSIVRHIERGDNERQSRLSLAKAGRVRDAAEELIAEANEQTVRVKPWEARIEQRQRFIRSAWLRTAMALETNDFNHKEQRNVPPEYDKVDVVEVRANQRAAAIYQSNLERLGFRAPTVALARMRDVSRRDVVQHQRPAQVLLHTNASNGMGRDSAADHDLRRPRTRALTIAAGGGSDGEGRRTTSSALAKPSLAAVVRRYVYTMPPVETERQTLRRMLANRLRREHDRDQARMEENEIPRYVDCGRKPSER